MPSPIQWLQLLLLYLLLINGAAFLLCGRDKQLAQKQRFRVPEKRLFGIAALGGAFGLFLGMQLFRHKTRHLSFQLGVPALCLLWLALLGGVTLWALLG